MARVTGRDVAAAAGVSQATVSFVLNGRHLERISEETRDLVLETAKGIGYVPSASGRALRAGHSNVVVCIIPIMRVSEAVEVFKRGLSAALAQFGYACVFIHPADEQGVVADFWKHVEPGAVISLGSLSAADSELLKGSGIAVLDGLLLPGDVQIIDQHEIGVVQVRHLVERGHRHIGYASVGDESERIVSAPRFAGAQDACRELGLPTPEHVQIDYTGSSAQAGLAQLLKSGSITAIVAFNDVVALALLAAAREQSVVVPDDVALIGVDDIALAALSVPALSTVSLDLTAAADTIAAHVVRMINEPDESPPKAQPGAVTVVRRATS